MTTDDDRIAYLTGDGSGALGEEERQELDELRATLSAPAVWSDPDPALEDVVVAAIAAEAASRAPRARRSTRRSSRPIWLRPAASLGVAAAAVVVVVAMAVVTSDDGSSSEQLVARLEPTGLVPGAAGEATLTRTDSGWRIELDATGLPRLEDGRFYQAWLEGQGGGLVAVGTFNEAHDVVLWAGVSPRTHPGLTITEEQTDGDATSSGREVLAGRIAEG